MRQIIDYTREPLDRPTIGGRISHCDHCGEKGDRQSAFRWSIVTHGEELLPTGELRSLRTCHFEGPTFRGMSGAPVPGDEAQRVRLVQVQGIGRGGSSRFLPPVRDLSIGSVVEARRSSDLRRRSWQELVQA